MKELGDGKKVMTFHHTHPIYDQFPLVSVLLGLPVFHPQNCAFKTFFKTSTEHGKWHDVGCTIDTTPDGYGNLHALCQIEKDTLISVQDLDLIDFLTLDSN